MTDAIRSGGLQTIFSFFLGLMVTAFVGVGVYTFFPPPGESYQTEIQRIDREEQSLTRFRQPDDLTAEERARVQALVEERDALHDRMREEREDWGRTTSIILIAFATLAMAVSLIRADQLPVISNGLLLGGVFGMVYGVGWIVATDSSISRFLVISAAFAITIGLGYVRFVRRRTWRVHEEPRAERIERDIESRVRALEERLDDAARAMGPRQPDQ